MDITKTCLYRPLRDFYFLLHVVMLLISIFLVISISLDTFHNEIDYRQPHFLRRQTIICAVFMADFFLEFFLAERKWHYLATHFLFFFISIPYLEIIHYTGWQFSDEVQYLLQFIPLLRGGYAMAIIVGWFAYNRATGLFITYTVTLISTVYFASLVFYMFEHGVNTLVNNYSDALWWATMDVTTVGSNIVAVTPVGRVLSVLLAALGMMMFPIFTVYVTSLITNGRNNVLNIPVPTNNNGNSSNTGNIDNTGNTNNNNNRNNSDDNVN